MARRRAAARVVPGARRRSAARLRSHRHPRARGRDGRTPAGGARDGARPHRPERHPLGGGLGRAWREHARRRARDAAGRHRRRRAGHARSARRHAARFPGVAHHRLAPGHHGVRGRRPRERAGRQRSQLRPAAARGRGAGGGVVRAVRAPRAQLTRRRGESGDPPRHSPGRPRGRSLGGQLRPLRGQAQCGRPAGPLGLLRGRALRAHRRLATGHHQPSRHRVRQARRARGRLERDAQLCRRHEPYPPSGQPSRERRGDAARLEFHPRRLLRAGVASPDAECAAGRGSRPALRERLRALARHRPVQREREPARLAAAQSRAHRRRRAPARRPHGLPGARAALVCRARRPVLAHRRRALRRVPRRTRLAHRFGARQRERLRRIRGRELGCGAGARRHRRGAVRLCPSAVRRPARSHAERAQRVPPAEPPGCAVVDRRRGARGVRLLERRLPHPGAGGDRVQRSHRRVPAAVRVGSRSCPAPRGRDHL